MSSDYTIEPDYSPECASTYADYPRHLIAYIKPKPSEGDQDQSPPEQAERELAVFVEKLKVILKEYEPIEIDRFHLGMGEVVLLYLSNHALPVGDAFEIARQEFPEAKY